MRVSINVLALCLVIACGLVLAACKSLAPTQDVVATLGESSTTKTLIVTPEEPPATEGTPTPERLSAVEETHNPPTTTTAGSQTPGTQSPASATPLSATPAMTGIPYPAPVSQPETETPGAYPPPVQESPNSYPAPITPVANSNAYPGPSTPVANSNAYPGPGTAIVTPTPGSPSNVTTTPVPTQADSTPANPLPTEADVPQPTPTFTSGTRTPTPTVYVVRTSLRPSDPKAVVLAAAIPQLVEFYARWSSDSQIMAPVINALEAKYHDRMKFTFLDIDDPANNIFKQTLEYQFAPHFFLLDGQGNIIKEWTGFMKVEDLETAIQAVVGQ